MKKIIDYLFASSIIVLLGIIVYVLVVVGVQGNTPGPDDKHTVVIHGSTVETLLNDNYVFVNLGPPGLPDNQGYMVDFIENDTIYLIPNTEEAGY